MRSHPAKLPPPPRIRASALLLALVLPACGNAADGASRGGAGSGATAVPAGSGWRDDAPGVRHRISADALPAPGATRSSSNGPQVVPMPAGARLRVPAGFRIDLFQAGLTNPRVLRVAPNGDVFVAETGAGRVRVLRAGAGARAPDRNEVFASGLDAPFGIAFFPPTGEPRFVYVATTNTVVRFPYASGDLKARGLAETVVSQLAPTSDGHSTRDLAFSRDGSRMFISVGSASNVADGLPAKSGAEVRAWEAAHGLGAAWGDEERRADVLVASPEGSGLRAFATGLRNCAGLAVSPAAGDLWCVTNERDGLGDDLVPDYATRVREGAFYGWPWWYLGDHEDPRRRGERPDLQGKITVPDVLFKAHSASLGLTFYGAAANAPAAFPSEYTGDGFAALHGSWNRAERTGYKVVRILMRAGVPTGEYEDFLTGFVVDGARVWGRPVGIAVGQDGALLVSEDGNGTVWRIAPEAPSTQGKGKVKGGPAAPAKR